MLRNLVYRIRPLLGVVCAIPVIFLGQRCTSKMTNWFSMDYTNMDGYDMFCSTENDLSSS